MDADLTILPVKQDKFGINVRRATHPLLPKIEEGANTIIVSSVKSGKTNLLANLLLNSNMLKDAMDEIYIFSNTIFQDSTGRKLLEAFPNTCYDTFDEGKLMRILDYQKSFDDEDRPSIGIILDDIQSLKPKSLFFTISTSFRHYGIGLLCYVVQNFKMIPPIVRSNATNLLIGTINSQQIKQIAEEYGGHFGGTDNFVRQHRLAVPARYNFLYARLDDFPAKLHKNFDIKPIYEDN